MANATSFQVEQKPRKRRLSAKQKAPACSISGTVIQDMKAEAEHMKDGELVLLIGMVELLVEERTAGSAARTARRCPPPIRPVRTRFQSEGKPAAYSGTASLSIRAWLQRSRLASTRGSADAVTPRTTA